MRGGLITVPRLGDSLVLGTLVAAVALLAGLVVNEKRPAQPIIR